MVIIIMIMIQIKSGSGDNNFYIGNLGTREKERENARRAPKYTLLHVRACNM